jgi:hypothetical protein
MGKRLWKYEGSITALGIFIGLGIIFGIAVSPEYVEKHNAILFPIWFYFSIIAGIPLMIMVIWKYRSLEKEMPSSLTKLYYGGRRPNRCSICKEHPVSKKYHMKNKHEIQVFDEKDYFVDCGCDICADYNKSAFTEGFYNTK